MMASNKTYWKVQKVSSTLYKPDGSLKVTMVKIEDGDNENSSSSAQPRVVYLYPEQFMKKDENKHAHINDPWVYLYLLADDQNDKQAVSFDDLEVTYDAYKAAWDFKRAKLNVPNKSYSVSVSCSLL